MTDAAAIVRGLQATLNRPGQSPRTAARCQRLIERLQTPVRVAVFGLPQAGKSALINALAEQTILQPGAQIAPVLIRHADAPRAVLTNGNGTVTPAAATWPFSPPPDVAMVELGVPIGALAGMDLLNVVADPEPEDLSAALAWAAARCDIAIWCTRHWTMDEQAIWQNGPDDLKNHCLMVATSTDSNTAAAQVFAACPEQDCLELTLEDGGTDITPSSALGLRQRIARMIEDARAADLDVAAFLLEQHSPDAEPVPQTNDAPRIALLPTPAPDDTTHADPVASVSPEARAVLSRLILHLRQTARTARVALAEDRTDAVLEQFQDAFEQMVELAEAEDAFLDTWPDLQDTLREAVDLILLLGLEGGTNQTTEAAILLAQVRQDMEFALAA